MNAPESVRIDSADAFLRWLESGRKGARKILAAAGMRDALIGRILATEALPDPLPYRAGDTIVDRETDVRFHVTDEVAGALSMLRVTAQIRHALADTSPRHRLVCLGVELIEARSAMFEAHWNAQRRRDEQKRRGQRGGRHLGAARSLVNAMKREGQTWKYLKTQLPRRNGSTVAIMGFKIRAAKDGRLQISQRGGSKSEGVSAATLRDYFSRN